MKRVITASVSCTTTTLKRDLESAGIPQVKFETGMHSRGGRPPVASDGFEFGSTLGEVIQIEWNGDGRDSMLRKMYKVLQEAGYQFTDFTSEAFGSGSRGTIEVYRGS